MGNTLIKVACTDQTLSVIENPLVAAGGIKEDVVEFQFCSLWDGFTKTAVFYRDKDNVYHVALDLNNQATIPKEVLTTEGIIYFGVYGVSGDVTRTSEVLRYKIKEGAIIEGTTPADPTPDIYTQILSKVASAESKVTTLETKVETVESSVTNLENNIGTTALTTTAQTLTGAVNEIKSNVDGIQIGGRNLMIGTNQGATGWMASMNGGTFAIAEADCLGAKGMKFTASTDAGANWAMICYTDRVNLETLEPDADYVLSFDALSNKETAVKIRISTSSSADPLTSFVTVDLAKDTWKRYTVAMHTASGELTLNNQCLFIDLKPGSLWYAGSELSIVNLKLERGNKVTDWTPAPEDFDAKIVALEARIAALEGS